MGQNDDMTIRAPDPGDSDRFNQVPDPEPASSGFQDAPNFETPPVYSEPPRPTEVPSYGQVVEPSRPQEVPSYGQVVDPPKKKNNRTLWIIIAVIVAVICCCCVVAWVGVSNYMQDYNIEDFEDFMNQIGQILKIAPAFI